MPRRCVLVGALCAAAGAHGAAPPPPPPSSPPYFAGVRDTGIVMPFGGAPGGARCPGDCDALGARDTWLFLDANDTAAPFKFFYDGSGPGGWLASLAETADPTLRNWTKRGTVLSRGPPPSPDSASASYLTTFFDPSRDPPWRGLYLATQTISPPPGDVPIGPYFSMAASAPTAAGPWVQDRARGTVIGAGSPGPIVRATDGSGELWQLCTGCAGGAIGLVAAAAAEGPWRDVKPLIVGEPIENFSLYFENATSTWFGFTNRIGLDAGGMAFDAAITVYWTSDLTEWSSARQAVVLNQSNVIEPTFQVGRIGLPSVLRVPGNDVELALLYDGGGTRGDVSYNENCSVALAWLRLPLVAPFW
jgi:hypothetical protein